MNGHTTAGFGMTFLVAFVLNASSGLAQEVENESAQPAAPSGVEQGAITTAPELVPRAELDEDVLQQVVTLLSGYEYFPTADDLRTATPDPVPYLLTIAYDLHRDWLPTHHHRAIDALGYFPTEQTHAHLSYLLTAASTPELMRHHLIIAMARGFDDQAWEEIRPFLESDDLQLRLTAVSAVSLISTPRSAEVLQSRLAVEQSELVRERIQEVLEGRRPDPSSQR